MRKLCLLVTTVTVTRVTARTDEIGDKGLTIFMFLSFSLSLSNSPDPK